VVGILSLFILSLAEQAWSIIKTSPVGSIFEIGSSAEFVGKQQPWDGG
jgi:hypothetical protein